MPLDSFIDSPMKRFWRQDDYNRTGEQPSAARRKRRRAPANRNRKKKNRWRRPGGYFPNAHNLVFNNPTMNETINYLLSTGKTVLEYLLPYTMPDAAMDSSARHPPPKCRPGTRLRTENKLKDWLYDARRQWRMIWLRGSVGTGKSAVAQTFAERCAGWGRLGAAYFISRSNKRNNPDTIVPSLAYQLAVTFPEYKSIINATLANDPQLVEKARPTQFRKLIVEPFLTLQRESPRQPTVIILDGLDECKGKNAQLEIIGMITEVLRLHPDLPLLWLICSRPEVHLKRAFSRVIDCGREELTIDAVCRNDVKRYLREGIAEIKTKYRDVTPPDWPPEDQLRELFDRVSGLFVLASTVLKHVDSITCADPVGQLDDMMACLGNAQVVGQRNPLVNLDLLYTQILRDIPKRVFSTTWRILAHLIYLPHGPYQPFSAQGLCNFLRLDQRAFYIALRGLHSVINVPEPETALRMRLRFHHTSFQDFLLDYNRSGKLFIDEREALLDIANAILYWHEVDVTHFHTNDGWDCDHAHNHASLPGLTWISADDEQRISGRIAAFAYLRTWEIVTQLSWADVDDDLLFRIHDFDFRYTSVDVMILAEWLCDEGYSDGLVRTKPSTRTDFQLLEYFKRLINNGLATPAILPLEWDRPWIREYFFIGHGIRTAIVFITSSDQFTEIHVLNGDQEPTEEMISRYQNSLDDIEWKEDRFADYI